MQAQDLGRAAGPVDDPLRLAEDGDDMAALDRFEGGDRGISCRDGGAGGQLGVDLEVTSKSRVGPVARMTARSSTFSSSRMFPGHR